MKSDHESCTAYGLQERSQTGSQDQKEGPARESGPSVNVKGWAPTRLTQILGFGVGSHDNSTAPFTIVVTNGNMPPTFLTP